MSVADFIAKVVQFLRTGYPQGVPATDYVPLLALLRRQLSDDDVIQIATQLVGHGALPVDTTDIRVMITKITDQITDQMPSPAEVERVRKHLQNYSWPTSDEFPTGG